MSRFEAKKNIKGVLNGFARYCRSCLGEPWKLVLVGTGSLDGELRRQAAELNMRENVMFAGPASYAELPSYYGLANALVHGSVCEQWGLVVNEAMASGLPVVVSDRCGCAPELVRMGINGFIFDPHNADDLASRLSVIASDAIMLERMGRESLALISRYGVENFANGLQAACDYASSARRHSHNFGHKLFLSFAALR